MNNLGDLKNKKIALLGLGIENVSFLRFLLKQEIDCQITVCDFRDKEKLGERFKEFSLYENVSWKLGLEFNRDLDVFDVLYRSPGWAIKCPGIQAALKSKVKLSSPMKVFFNFCPTENIIGVTGTKGKGTTSSLIFEILKADKRQVFLGGNIGVAPFDFFEKLDKDAWVVLELSSFQLEDMDKSPRFAVITNFSPEHLSSADSNNPNCHESLEAYWEAKANVFKWQNKEGILVVHESVFDRIKNQESRIKKYGKSMIGSNLVGEHNKENVAAAEMVAEVLYIDHSIVKDVVKNFKGLPFRTEFIKEVNGVKFYNDSFATIPESSVIGLRSFSEPIILLAGGADKGADFNDFAKEIKIRQVKKVVLFKGQGSEKIKKELEKIDYDLDRIVEDVESMEAAFLEIKNEVEKGDVVLLSTACASFGVFKNYKERGELFNKEVEKLINVL